MIRPISPPPTPDPAAAFDRSIPRVLVHSEVTAIGDTVEILRPRYADRFIQRFLAPKLSRARYYECYPLDARGSRIWCLIDNSRSVAEVVAEYRKFYPDDHSQIDQRIRQYLETLADHGFIEIVAG